MARKRRATSEVSLKLDRERILLFPHQEAAEVEPSPPRLVSLCPSRNRRLRSPATGSGAATLPRHLAPLLAADAPLSGEIERRLTALALAARAGDGGARDALYHAFAPKLDRMLGRCRGLAWAAAGPRRDGRPWELDDLAQEAYLVFVDLLAEWSGEGAVGPYLLAHLRWRLRTAWNGLAAPRRREAAITPRLADLLADGSAAADEATVLLETLAAALPPPDAAMLLMLVRDGCSPAVVARRLGVSRRTVDRRWGALVRRLRASLRPEVADAARADAEPA